MYRRSQIVQSHEDPIERFTRMMDLLLEINAEYDYQLFIFDEEGIAHVNEQAEKIIAPHLGGSIIRMPEGSGSNVSAFSREWSRQNGDRQLVKLMLPQRFNLALEKEERLILANDYLIEKKGKITDTDVRDKYHLSYRQLINLRNSGTEKLIEVWHMDIYGDSAGDGTIRDTETLAIERLQRTGIYNGYYGKHPEWVEMFGI